MFIKKSIKKNLITFFSVLDLTLAPAPTKMGSRPEKKFKKIQKVKAISVSGKLNSTLMAEGRSKLLSKRCLALWLSEIKPR